MKKYTCADIRNVGLIGHGAVGKTSVAEAMVFTSGVSDRLGKVGDSSSFFDYDPEEVKRGYSLNASLAFLEWDKKKINVIDSPGSGNFIGDTFAALRVIDGSVYVVSADTGLQYFTEKFWREANDFEVRPLVFINKIDHERADLDNAVSSIQKKLKNNPVLVQLPVGSNENTKGIVDLIGNVCYLYDKEGNGIGKESPIPEDMADEVESARAELIESVAECDEDLLEKYFEEGSLSDEELVSGLKKAIDGGDLIPVFCGSATLNIGIDLLMQGIVNYVPSPDQRPPIIAKSLNDDSEVIVTPGMDAPFCGLVFKTIADPYAGKLTIFRVFSGTINSDSSTFNSSKNVTERIGSLFAIQGKNQDQVNELVAGDFATVAKLKETETSDTLCNQDFQAQFDSINFPTPILSRAVVPKTRADEEKISGSLHRLTDEDKTLQVERNSQTHELLVSGLGQVHLDVILDKLKRRFGVEVDVKSPKIPYRETIRGKTKIQGKYKKQSGGRGQFGDTWLEIEPLTKGSGFEFVDKIVGGAIPKTYIPAVEKGIAGAMEEGVLAHFPMVDIKVTLYDGSFHAVDSSEMAFKIAGSMGFKKGVMDCKPILLEPIMTMEVVVPSECVGDVMGDLNSKRGKILGIDAEEETQVIRVEVPMASVLNYAPDITSLTGGRGIFTMEFSHYYDVPEHLTGKIVEQAQKTYEESKSS
jgi:elongation factor G